MNDIDILRESIQKILGEMVLATKTDCYRTLTLNEIQKAYYSICYVRTEMVKTYCWQCLLESEGKE